MAGEHHFPATQLFRCCSAVFRLLQRSFSGKKKEPKPKLFGPDIFRWGGGLPREGVGAKKFGMSLETREIKYFWQDIPGFYWDSPAVPEKLEKKKFVFNFWPLAFGQNDIRTAETPMLQCKLLQRSIPENCSATSVFRLCGMLQGWGLEGWGLSGDKRLQNENAMELGICSCKASGEKWREICRAKSQALSSFVS